jgi:site-specific DNA-methyltransferase (adenine-specific)
MNHYLMKGNCLELMKEIPDGYVDMILCDLPYGTTACKWDSVIPFEPLWEQYRRVIKKNGAIVLTASQPFTSALVMSNAAMFKYCWVWDKKKPSNYPLAKQQPMKYHEDICVFSSGKCAYFPEMVPVAGRKAKKGVNKNPAVFQGGLDRPDYLEKVYTDKYPSSILEVSNADQRNRQHPTQKPVALMEYLIRTYTNEGETVLDNTMGSGTTGVACANTKRNFLGIEMDDKYFDIAEQRIEAAYASTTKP